MLAALLLLGLLPLAMIPLEDVSDDGANDPDGAADPPNVTTTIGGNPDVGDPPEDGAVYQLTGQAGETVIPDFSPGTDLVEVDLTAMSGEIVFDMATSADGAWVSFAVGDNLTATVEFTSLAEIPYGDIILKMIDDETGEMFEQTLGDVFALSPNGAETDAETGTVTEPTDPDNPDGPGPLVTGPVTDPTDPEAPDPQTTDPIVGPVTDPIDPNAEPLGQMGELTLAELLQRDSDNSAGAATTLSAAFAVGPNDTILDNADDQLALTNDGVAGTGQGSISLAESLPVVATPGTLEVVDGSAGDDTITTGDTAAFVFGGQGADNLTAGEGAAALFGGAGDDALGATSTAAYLDGGAGDDSITGGAGDDTLEGGEHGAASVAGNDTIDGGAGNDLIRGGFGADQLSGGTGDDVIDHMGRTEERAIAEHHEFTWHIDGAADSLTGGTGVDTLIFDQMDVATGGAGEDVFWLYNDGSDGAEVAEVTDFEVGVDFLRISLNPHIGENDIPVVEVEPSGDGADGLVIVNGDLVAVLRGAPTATASDIFAEVQPDVFPAGPGGFAG